MLLRAQVTAAVISLSLAACGGSQVLTGTTGAPSSVTALDSAPPCKGQKNTKEYASIGAKALSTKGGTLCVPSFGGWGGTMDYPGPTSQASMALISSTTAYNPGAFPPPGSVNPIFYIQFKMNSYGVVFSSKLPAAGGLSSKSLTVGKFYTAQGASDVGSLWDVLGECSTKAFATGRGPTILGIGFVLENVHMGEASSGVISILPGKLATSRC
jgi:hypothetical protein